MSEVREMSICIVSVTMNTQCPKNGGGTYPGCEVIYKTTEGEVQTKLMHNNTFKFNKALEEDLKVLTSGNYVHIVMEKKGDFVNWVSAKRTEAPVVAPEQATTAPQTSQATPVSKAPTQAVVRSNYETPEERTIKQRYIVRQSCLGYAINFFALDKDFLPQSENVIALAKEFEAYVFANANGEVPINRIVKPLPPATSAAQQVQDDADADFVIMPT